MPEDNIFLVSALYLLNLINYIYASGVAVGALAA